MSSTSSEDSCGSPSLLRRGLSHTSTLNRSVLLAVGPSTCRRMEVVCAHSTFRSSPMALSVEDNILPGSCLYSAHLGHDLRRGNAKGKAHVPDSEFASSRQNLCEGGLKVPLQLLPGCLPGRCSCLCFDTVLLSSSRPECTGSLLEVAWQ